MRPSYTTKHKKHEDNAGTHTGIKTIWQTRGGRQVLEYTKVGETTRHRCKYIIELFCHTNVNQHDAVQFYTEQKN